MKFTFKRGVHLSYGTKSVTSVLPIREYVTDFVKIPMSMHIGAPSVPVVAVGDYVSAGQLIAKCPDGALGSAIHASISGKVVSVSDSIEISSAL